MVMKSFATIQEAIILFMGEDPTQEIVMTPARVNETLIRYPFITSNERLVLSILPL